MAQRITEEDLENRISHLNNLMGYKRVYVKSKAQFKGKAFGLDSSMGGYRVITYNKVGSSINNISGRGTKRETFDHLVGMIQGILMYKKRNK